MRKIFSTLLISTMLLGTGSACFAQTLSAEALKSLVAQQIKNDLNRYELEEIEVNVSNVPVANLAIPDGKVSVIVTSNSNGLNAREYKKVSILVNKKPVQATFVQAEVKAYKTVAVAKEMIARDKAIPFHAVEMKKTDVLKYINETMTLEDLSQGLLAKKVFYAGEVLSKKYTASRPDVLKDAMVSVNFKTDNNLTIEVEGIALNQGNIGDVIKVKNKRLNRIYTGTIVGENRVLIQI